jgi:hypothetical protein
MVQLGHGAELSFVHGSRQTLAMHCPTAQSEVVLQPCPAGHLFRQVPPQSTPVSAPFFSLSLQVAARHTPFVQTLSRQSAHSPQRRPAAHNGHDESSPQSMSTSFPSCTPSAQLFGRQMWSLQKP